MPYYTYILYSSTVDKYYIGSSEDATKRLKRHNAGHSKSTKSGIPWILAYTEEYSTRAEAYRREMAIKRKKSRIYIENIIKGSVG